MTSSLNIEVFTYLSKLSLIETCYSEMAGKFLSAFSSTQKLSSLDLGSALPTSHSSSLVNVIRDDVTSTSANGSLPFVSLDLSTRLIIPNVLS